MRCGLSLTMLSLLSLAGTVSAQPYCPPVASPGCPPDPYSAVPYQTGSGIYQPVPAQFGSPLSSNGQPLPYSQPGLGMNPGQGQPALNSSGMGSSASAGLSAPTASANSQFGTMNAAPPVSNSSTNLSGFNQQLASSSTSANYAPNMLGDFFTQGGLAVSQGGTIESISSPGAGGGAGRTLVSDNSSPLPNDRVFVDYNFFQNAPIAPGGVSVNRITPGIEKTFLDGTMSVELRAPMAIGLNSSTAFDGQADDDYYEFGNLTVYTKALLFARPNLYVSAGLGITLPTANNSSTYTQSGTLAQINNQSVHLLPYLAALWVPNSIFFGQAFVQVDVDTNGNPVLVDSTGIGGGPLTVAGRYQDQTFLRSSFSGGAWLYRDPSRFISAVALTGEVHYTAIVGRDDSVTDLSSGVTVSNPTNGVGSQNDQFNIVNLTLGTHFFFGPKQSLSVGYGVPVTNDRAFDGEARVFYNRYF